MIPHRSGVEQEIIAGDAEARKSILENLQTRPRWVTGEKKDSCECLGFYERCCWADFE